jgi:hypothetical protein
MDLATALSVASTATALASALFAASAARSARRSAELAQHEFDERSKGLRAHLVDAIQWTRPDRREIVAISFTLTNLASLPNTVIRTELVLHEYARTDEPSRLILPPVDTDGPPGRTLQRIGVPLNLAPRETTSGWLIFLIPDSFAKCRTVDKYELAFVDSTGKRANVETHLMHRIVYAKTDG